MTISSTYFFLPDYVVVLLKGSHTASMLRFSAAHAFSEMKKLYDLNRH